MASVRKRASVIFELCFEPRLYPPPKRQKRFTQNDLQGKRENEGFSSGIRGESTLWAEKYRPKTRSDIIGNQNLVTRLYTWLETWKTKTTENIEVKSGVLISGPSGVGKTAAALAVSMDLEFTTISIHPNVVKECRLLSKVINKLDGCQSLTIGSSCMVLHKNTVIIVDEMDGMEEKTIQALYDLLQKGSIPVILICNDRYHKSLCKILEFTMELKFQKPKRTEILKLLTCIQESENIHLEKATLEMLIDSSQRDVRQVLNQLQYLSAKGGAYASHDARDIVLNSFATVDSLCAEVWTRSYYSLETRTSLVLQDVDFVSLLVQENYVNYKPAKQRNNAFIMDALSKASDYLCVGDLIQTRMHQQRRWELTGIFSTIIALTCSSILQGTRQSFNSTDNNLRFPVWLTKHKTNAGCRVSMQDRLVKVSETQKIPRSKHNVVSVKQTSDELLAILKQGR